MSLFTIVEGESCVLSSNGVYRQVDVYKRGEDLFAAHSGGFIRLYADGSTSKPKVRIDFLTWTGTLYKDRLGRLAALAGPGRTPLNAGVGKLLTGMGMNDG